MNTDEIKRIDAITKKIHDLLNGRNPERISTDDQPSDEIKQLSEYTNHLIHDASQLATALAQLSSGNLDFHIASSLAVGSNLKNLQATLKHLTWQTQQVTKGDFSQRVDFLGEFSASFNLMVEQLERNRAELTQMAMQDPLTGAYNSRFFREFCKKAILSAHRNKTPFSALMIDIDHFKIINDTHGHAVGDEAIKAFVSACVNNFRGQDIIGRLGGEEFAVALPETTRDGAFISGERLRNKIAENKLEIDGTVIQFTVSMGVATLASENDTIDMILNRADILLYKAKESGRNKVVMDEL